MPTSPCDPCDFSEILSRHATSTGTVLYARCQCGELQVRLIPFPHTTPVIAHTGRP